MIRASVFFFMQYRGIEYQIVQTANPPRLEMDSAVRR